MEWNLPPKTWFKLNFDGSRTMESYATRGFICNAIGKMVVSYSRNYGGGSNNEAKGLNLLWGSKLMRKHGNNRLMVEGDSLLIIKVVKGDS